MVRIWMDAGGRSVKVSLGTKVQVHRHKTFAVSSYTHAEHRLQLMTLGCALVCCHWSLEWFVLHLVCSSL